TPGIATRRLDLDHVGAEVGEQHPRERPRHVLRVLQDPQPRQRQVARLAGRYAHRASPSSRRAITVRWISAAPPEIVVATEARWKAATRPAGGPAPSSRRPARSRGPT